MEFFTLFFFFRITIEELVKSVMTFNPKHDLVRQTTVLVKFSECYVFSIPKLCYIRSVFNTLLRHLSNNILNFFNLFITF